MSTSTLHTRLDEDGVDMDTGLVHRHKAGKAGQFSRELAHHRRHLADPKKPCTYCVNREVQVQKHSPYRLFPALSHMTPEEIENLRRKPRNQKLDPIDSPSAGKGKGKGKAKKKGKGKGKRGKGKNSVTPLDQRPPWGNANASSAKKALERNSYVASAAPYDDPERAERHWNRVMRSKRIGGDFVPSGGQRLAKDRVSTMVFLESPSESYLLKERYEAQQRKALGQTLEYDLVQQQRRQWQADRKAAQRADRHAYQQRLLQTLPPTPTKDNKDTEPDQEGGDRYSSLGPDDIVYIEEEPESMRKVRRPRPIYDDDVDDDYEPYHNPY